jgi:phosphoenolpyruvate carboxykinase (GTP)
VLEWIVGRIEEEADAVETPIGLLPATGSLDLEGLEITDAALEHLFDVDRDSWLAECDLTEEYFAQFGDRVPAALKAELASLRYHLSHQAA